jgi:hypothetical protein
MVFPLFVSDARLPIEQLPRNIQVASKINPRVPIPRIDAPTPIQNAVFDGITSNKFCFSINRVKGMNRKVS